MFYGGFGRVGFERGSFEIGGGYIASEDNLVGEISCLVVAI